MALPARWLTCSEWITNQHRDTSASIIGNNSLTSYLAVADGEAKARVKFEQCEVRRGAVPRAHPQRMLQPCGPPPERSED